MKRYVIAALAAGLSLTGCSHGSVSQARPSHLLAPSPLTSAAFAACCGDGHPPVGFPSCCGGQSPASR